MQADSNVYNAAFLSHATGHNRGISGVSKVSAKQCKICEDLDLVPHLQAGHCHQHCHKGFGEDVGKLNISSIKSEALCNRQGLEVAWGLLTSKTGYA